MKTRLASAAVVLLASVSSALANDAEHVMLSRIRLTTDAAVTRGCTRLGNVSDDSVKDLRRKIARGGGDTALLTFGVKDPERIYAEVYRCPAPAQAPARTVPPPPPGTPPPPPGAPPAPPPATPATPPGGTTLPPPPPPPPSR